MNTFFTMLDGLVVEITCGTRKTIVRTLEDLRELLDDCGDFDAQALERVGVIACFLAADQQWRSGGDLDWNGVQKALDPYFFVLQAQAANAALHRGIEAGIERLRELRSATREGDFRRELIRMLS